MASWGNKMSSSASHLARPAQSRQRFRLKPIEWLCIGETVFLVLLSAATLHYWHWL